VNEEIKLKKKYVAIHQPQYFPWPGYFEKILNSDVFIFLDDVQYQKNGLQNRNRIKSPTGEAWLTLPVQNSLGTNIKDITIVNRLVKLKNLKTLQTNYAKANFFHLLFPKLQAILDSDCLHLSRISIDIILFMLKHLGYKGRTLLSSELNSEGEGKQKIVNLCKEVKATHYLSGVGGLNYLDRKPFSESDIEVIFQQYKSQEYRQCFPKIGFIPGLSAIDLLFNEGQHAEKIIDPTINKYLNWDEIKIREERI